MDKKQRLEAAIVALLPVVATLSAAEWSRICQQIQMSYTTKAAKCQLDGEDLETLERSLRHEMLGEDLFKPLRQSE